MFPRNWRHYALAALDRPFDLVIVGGGINGAGVLMDASQRGLRTILVERGDFASGTSSRSSKLIHGGLRYLKQLQLRLTRTACAERDRQLALNPLLVRPVQFVYPVRRGARMPAWKLEMGLRLYDRWTRRPEKHRRLDPRELAAVAPDFDTKRLDRTLAYADAVADDARLTLAVVATGVAFGGAAISRCEALEGLRDGRGRLSGLVVRDLETGRTHEVQARLVVNAGGVWADRIRALVGIDTSRLRPSRGSHLIFESDRLPLEAAVAMPSPDDGRPVFLVPHPDGVLLGTTDLFHDGPLEDPRVTADERDYLLRALQEHFPGLGLGQTDVVGAFAGLRPILDDHAATPSEASRDEAIWEERGLLTVAGGKLTTWRATAEEAVDAAIRHLTRADGDAADVRPSDPPGPCLTRGIPLTGLAPADLAARLERSSAVSGNVAAAMARRLRADAWDAVEAAAPDDLRPLHPDTDLSPAEVAAHLRGGAVVHLEDFLLRRVRLGLWNPPLASEVAPLLRESFETAFGWDTTRWGRELDQFHAALESWSPAAIG